mgnify:CR=1 FL=1
MFFGPFALYLSLFSGLLAIFSYARPGTAPRNLMLGRTGLLVSALGILLAIAIAGVAAFGYICGRRAGPAAARRAERRMPIEMKIEKIMTASDRPMAMGASSLLPAVRQTV